MTIKQFIVEGRSMVQQLNWELSAERESNNCMAINDTTSKGKAILQNYPQKQKWFNYI